MGRRVSTEIWTAPNQFWNIGTHRAKRNLWHATSSLSKIRQRYMTIIWFYQKKGCMVVQKTMARNLSMKDCGLPTISCTDNSPRSLSLKSMGTLSRIISSKGAAPSCLVQRIESGWVIHPICSWMGVQCHDESLYVCSRSLPQQTHEDSCISNVMSSRGQQYFVYQGLSCRIRV